MRNSEFLVGIVGFGQLADTHLEAWRANEGTRVTSVVDDCPVARERARGLGMTAYQTVDELLKSERLNAVSICAPTSFHPAHVLEILHTGIPVLCEKPLAADLASAQELIDGAARSGVEFQLATPFRHVPDIRKARDIIRHGIIGDPLTFQVESSGKTDMSNRWNSKPSISGGGVLIDKGCHAVDTVRFLLSGIVRVQGVALRPVQTLPVEDSAMMLATTECGVTGNITLSWSMKSWNDFYITIHGAQGTIQIGSKKSYLHVDGEPPVQIGEGCGTLAAYKRMTGMFRGLVEGSEGRWISYEDALAASAVIEAAYRSMQTSRWTRVPGAQVLRRSIGLAASR